MRHRLLAVLLLILGTVAFTPSTACACSCAPLKPSQQMKGSAAVFTGTVTAVRRVSGGDPLGPPPPLVYTFRADQIYKGAPSATYEIATNADSAACGVDFTVGSRYLVFAAAGQSGLFDIDPGVRLHTSLCAGNREVRRGTGPLRPKDGIVRNQDGYNGERLDSALLTALGKPKRAPAPTVTPSPTVTLTPGVTPSPTVTLTPGASGASGGVPALAPAPAPAPAGIYTGAAGAGAGAAIAFAGWRLLRRRPRP
ncbi:hypothetical protein [Microtetraspora sp. NBRC 16547]|uniref:hypothetical protein n=1 Tax=Microtetraspora sp. NBRC 16547 TaxID=3030993 RepID=UPI0024A3EBC8|nr:hypothetical protein [Microtetraspora sp. NBRC 16547]GLX01378.1 hypothetical protein Misp02_54640 [Microtetraspora sp. NBRC 16547]